MADIGATQVKKSFFNYLKEYWFLLAFITSVAVAGWNSFKAVEADTIKNTGDISSLGTHVDLQVQTLRNSIATKATSFMVERDIDDVESDILVISQTVDQNEEDIEQIEDAFNELRLQDQQIEAKIELETEKLKRAIEQAAREQSQLLNSILQEIRN